MLHLSSSWPFTIGPCLGEGTRSRLGLTGEPREWYARIQENVSLGWQQGGNSGRRIIFGRAGTPIWGSKSHGKLVHESKQPVFERSLNNSGSIDFGLIGRQLSRAGSSALRSRRVIK